MNDESETLLPTEPPPAVVGPSEVCSRPTLDGSPDRVRTVGVVGLGYVGLPLAAALLRAGHAVHGFDRDERRVATLRGGHSPHSHLDPRAWRSGARGGLQPHVELERVAECDVLSLCLPTPATAEGEPDLEPLRSAARALAPHLRAGQLVLLHSTVHPGVTREVLAPLLAASGLEPGRDLWIAHSPEREDPGRGLGTEAVPRLVGGLCPRSGDLAEDFLRTFVDEVHRTPDAETSEAAKLHENVYRAVNIALVAELAETYARLGLDPHAVIDAAATKPYGFQAFRPGPGPGGHCIPVDPRYLLHAARAAGAPSGLVELALAVNAAQPERTTRSVLRRLEALGRRPSEARILLLGLAYKRGVGDLRESPALEIADRLLALGAAVTYADPNVDVHDPKLESLFASGLRGPVPASAASADTFDLAVLLTDHAEFDLARLRRGSLPVIDPRGALR